MLSIYRRHYGKCKNHSTRSFQCGCPIWAVGRIGGIRVRRALNLRSWDQAKELVVKWNSQGFVDLDQPKPSRQATVEVPAPTNTSARSKDPATVEEAIQRFFLNLHTRQVSPATLKKYRFLLDKQLIGFCQSRGFLSTRKTSGKADCEAAVQCGSKTESVRESVGPAPQGVSPASLAPADALPLLLFFVAVPKSWG
jgi:hypothetical protein